MAEKKGVKATPDSNSILAYKLLADAWEEDGKPNVFKDLMKNEMKYLASGLSLLQADPYLQMHYGAVDLNSAEQVANVLKSKVNELEVKNRLEPTASALLKHKYTAAGMEGLEPGLVNAVGIGSDKKLMFGVKSAGKFEASSAAVANPFNIFGHDKVLKGITFKA